MIDHIKKWAIGMVVIFAWVVGSALIAFAIRWSVIPEWVAGAALILPIISILAYMIGAEGLESIDELRERQRRNLP